MYVQEKKKSNAHIGLIPEGANMTEALPGSITLALDILRNEFESEIHFDHIFIDSGTGLMAIATLLSFSYLKKQTQLHILQVAGNYDEFINLLELYKKIFEELFHLQINCYSPFKLYLPTIARSFGSTNTTVLKTIIEMGRSNGILIDPIYNSKLFYEGKKIINENKLTGNILFINSGGGLSLFGFEDKIKKTIKN
jgi:1-aminocyclopropane-1-carboxylate deaminase/D-cysteine desulfhydrase-like pyridoxal-dependent ACC family enzyme